MAMLASLHLHPVKSCRALDCDAAMLGPRGLAGDREWVVVDRAGRFATQRTHPRLARVIARADGGALLLSAEGLEPLQIARDAPGPRVEVTVWRDRCAAIDAGDAAARWFGAVLDADVRLVRVAPELDRHADPDWCGPIDAATAFQDGFPLLVCNRASLDDLNRRLPEALPMVRFRPNLVIDGLEPWEEDRIVALEIGAARLALVKPCTRCVITATDPVTGARALDPLPVLKSFRFDRRLSGVTFGENAVIERGIGCTLRRGDVVRVIHE